MGISIYELFVLVILFSFILWVIAFIDVLRNEFTGYNKLIWLVVVIFVPFVGPIAYFIMGKKLKVKKG